MRSSSRIFSKIRLRSFDRPLRYSFAGLCLIGAFVLRNELTPMVEDRVPFMFFAPAAIMAAWIGGLGPGLTSLGFGTILGQYFFVSPYDSLLPNTKLGILLLAPYMITTLLAIMILHALQKATRRAEQVEQMAQRHVESLREQVVERKRVEELLRQARAAQI
jgi:K+-sensing histidine kinase KdpD